MQVMRRDGIPIWQEELGMSSFITSFEEIGRAEGQRDILLR